VPPCVAPAGTAREAAKVPVRGVIEGAFASQLSRISVCDMPSHTEIEVVIHAGPSDMYKFAGKWSIDPEARGRNLLALMTMYQMSSPQIISVEPSADADGTPQLLIGYSDASQDQICWEFCEYGYCCSMESFIITIVMQPWGCEVSQVTPSSPVLGKEAAPVPVAPAHVPASANGFSSRVSLKCGGDKQAALEGASDDEKTVSTSAGSERSDSPPPTPIRKPSMKFCSRSDRVCWADIEDD